jgi:hypothetical protein
MKPHISLLFVLCSVLTRVAFTFQAGATSVPTTTTLQSSTNPSNLGQAVTLTTTVSPASATGKVTFYDGVSVLGVGTLSAGKTALTTALLPSGIRSLKAFYGGDTQNQSSASAALSQPVMALAQKGFQPPVNYLGVSFIRTIAVADFNGDGIADLAADDFENNKVGVYLGKGDGTFLPPVTYPTQQAPFGVVAADFNGDGRMDLAVCNGATPSNTLSVLIGKGDGTFHPAVN